MVSTLFYVVFFAVGPGSIPWMITAELFSQVGDEDDDDDDDYEEPKKITNKPKPRFNSNFLLKGPRPAAMSVAVLINWY